MVCPQCHAENPEGSRFCHQCAAPLTPGATSPAAAAGASPPPTPPDASVASHFVVHQRTSPTLKALVAGLVVAGIVLLTVVAAGAYLVIKGRSAPPSGPIGYQPHPAQPGPSGAPQVPAQPASPQPPMQPPVPPPATPQPPAQPPAAPQPPVPPPAQPLAPAQPPALPQVPAPPPAEPAPTPPPPQLGPQPPAQVSMQTYQDPQGHWSVEYPQGWQVRSAPNGFTTFYQDDPDEGTTFTVLPGQVLQGEVGAAQFLEVLVGMIRQTYPDFQVTNQRMQASGGAGELGLAEGAWTNHRGEQMQGVLAFSLLRPGNGSTVMSLITFQAPRVAFSSLEPVFVQMFKSFRSQ